MCGIIGYTGPLSARKILLEGLSQLEYRGYDSAGIACVEDGAAVRVTKTTGKVAELKKLCQNDREETHCGIGHTRWATHGGVTRENAHPHQAGRVTLIHNGIIENYHQLTKEYHLEGKLVSQTDSEVAAWVLDSLYDGDPKAAIRRFVEKLEGSYGFCILFADRPGEIYAIRRVSPLVAAYTRAGSIIASDLTALIPYTKKYMVVPEDQIVKLTPYQVRVFDLDGRETQPEILEVNWDTDAAMKNGFPHFMLKEIHEQPEALKNTILPRISKGMPDFSDDGIPDEVFKQCSQVHIVACGTAMHAGMVARALMEPLLRVPVSVSIASEFRYEDPLIDEKTLTIIISQSGETIDTLAAMRLAKEAGSKTLAVVNVKGSTIARESDFVLYTHAGPEIAVASTKAYSVQLAALYLIICRMAYVRGKMSGEESAAFVKDLLDVIPAMEAMIRRKEEIRQMVRPLVEKPDAFFIGRNLDYAFSLEGALKLKEISYIHADAYAAGELKHGTIALISDEVPVIAIATQERIFAKSISNVREVKARGAYVILITKESAQADENLADVHIHIPDVHDRFTVFPIAVVLQLIAYYASLLKGLDVDQPRNLAKSVTVE
ncbi:glutamine--fructose-6-phosphate transaminase (isomerizing) [Lachnoclostridium sp. An14]|uniref:glutamine--fructose-6-phosphate transaminase (isomerizing) n=1 Tax=Lachnoclostridium sp. An14 TaxID=1965562 RepID=UPI000B3A0BE7|nr:glutamine--fructose-6-phosphate transaminase (isomerizing) [Lachnoclostridium sp. An14]OUQ15495.1 glutamine--fructose-6-phosphate transaminase (isomerizing) [Lachnoclostridium sp. An14]